MSTRVKARLAKTLLGSPVQVIGNSVVAACSFVLLVFLQPHSIDFWIFGALTTAAAILLWSLRPIASISIVVISFAYIAAVLANASWIVSDAFLSYGLKRIEGIRYITLPKDSILLPAAQSLPNIRGHLHELDCNGYAVYRLPLISVATINTKSAGAGSATFLVRHLPYPLLKTYAVRTQAQAFDNNGKQALSAGFQANPNSLSSIDITEYFPRSLSCQHGNVPLIPMFEFLPLVKGETDRLILAAALIKDIKQIVHDSDLMPTELFASKYISKLGPFEPLFLYAQMVLANRAIQGNVFWPEKVKLIDQACAVMEAHSNLFSGPLSHIKDSLYLRLATRIGNRSTTLYPACRISPGYFELAAAPDDFGELHEDFARVRPKPASADCAWSVERPGLEVYACQTNNNSRDGAPPHDSPKPYAADPCSSQSCREIRTRGRLSERGIAAVEKHVSDRYLLKSGALASMADIDAISCHAFFDKATARRYVHYWLEQSKQRFWRRVGCDASKFTIEYISFRALDVYAIRACAKSNSVDISEDDVAMRRNLNLEFYGRCRATAEYSSSSRLLLSAFDDQFRRPNLSPEAWDQLREWLPEGTMKDLRVLFDEILALQENACKGRGLFDCVSDPDRLNDIVAHYSARGWKEAFFDAYSSVRTKDGLDLIKLSSLIQNRIVDMMICHALSDLSIQQTVKITQAQFCNARGLSEFHTLLDVF